MAARSRRTKAQLTTARKAKKYEAVNRWIRTGGAFDAVVDFDAVIRDPANPKRFRKEFTNGDNLHPNDAGYKAMAEAVNLAVFKKK